MSKEKAFGSWDTPITSDVITQQSIKLLEVHTDSHELNKGQNNDDIFWVESRPVEKGRFVVVSEKLGDCHGEQFNARTRVHEYGGASVLIAEGVMYFCDFISQHLYRRKLDSGKEEIVCNVDGYRYADGIWDAKRKRIICVLEDHTQGKKEPQNSIISLNPNASTPEETVKQIKVLAQGHDFFAAPTLSADGKYLSYISWDHPNMPFFNTQLYVQELDSDGNCMEGKDKLLIAGENGDEAVLQPKFSPFDTPSLYFVSDRSDGWWNLHRYDIQLKTIEKVLPNTVKEEFAIAAWMFGQSNYVILDQKTILCTFGGKLVFLDLQSKAMEVVQSNPFSSISCLSLTGSARYACFIGGSPTRPHSVVKFDISKREFHVLKASFDVSGLQDYFSIPEKIEFPTCEGNVKKTAFANFYRPKNKDFHGPSSELPPLIVKIHGGPTSQSSTVLQYAIQYWTSRGFAVLDVDYGGSTGYGREFRMRLHSTWGIVDVDDCCNGALHISKDLKLADEKRLAITGGSAGGFTTIAALAFRPSVFAAGASHYGVCDLEMLASDTHKFESRYLDLLIAEYPKGKQTYIDRSPIHFTHQIKAPLAIFQGDEDKIVPPNQSQKVYEALKEKNIPVSYVLFKGEQHGFRNAKNIKEALEGEYYFYSKIFGFVTESSTSTTIPIDNFTK